MTAEQFAYWMQGFAELSGDAPPSAEQWKSIREHLATVLVKVTPPVGLSKLRLGDPPNSDWQRYVPGEIARPGVLPMRSECAARFEPLAAGASTC